jgi:hypothetical protein
MYVHMQKISLTDDFLEQTTEYKIIFHLFCCNRRAFLLLDEMNHANNFNIFILLFYKYKI